MSVRYGWIHCHTENSIKDSFMTIKQLVSKAKDMGCPAVTLTDHGTLTGVRAFLKECAKQGIKGVPGVEAYVVDDGENIRKHLILLPKDNVGYKQISLAVTESNKNIVTSSRNKKLVYPCMNKSILKKYFGSASEGYGHVIATSACVGGVVAGIAFESAEASDTYASHMKLIKASDDATKLIGEKEALLESLTEKKAELDALSKKSYGKQKKAAQNVDDPVKKEECLKAISEDEKKSLDAKELLPKIREDIASVKKEITGLKKNVLTATEYKRRTKLANDAKKFVVSDEQLYKLFRQAMIDYDDLFGHGNFYCELQNHGMENEIKYMPKLAEIAKTLEIPVVAANDAHMVAREDVKARKYVNALRFSNFKYYEPNVGEEELYLKSDEELCEWLAKILPDDVVTEAMENVGVILDSCEVTFEKEPHYPRFDNFLSKEESEQLLEELARKAIPDKYPVWNDELEARLMYELSIINSMGFTDYFLVVQDFLNIGRKLGHVPESRLEELRTKSSKMSLTEFVSFIEADQSAVGLSIGPGRGSGAGSIVCYLIGITSVDPIKYQLVFERFLNPERVSMPDIDSDFSNEIRDLVIEYCRKKYGYDGVSGIMTRSTLAAKAVIERVCSVYGSEKNDDSKSFLKLSDKIKKCIPNKPGVRLKDCENEINKKFKDTADAEDVAQILELAKKLEGTYINIGQHAAGVVISDNGDLKQHVPLMWDPENLLWKTQWDKDEVESGGLLKMDFLGLINLDIITKTLRLMQKNGKDVPDVEKLTDDCDPAVVEMMAKGQTDAVFQFSSSGMKSTLASFKPTTFEDLILLIAIFRPGPMQFIGDVTDVKNGKKKMQFLVPELEPILSNTYGAIIYQEQVMQIFQQLAGYSLGGADLVRRAMGHKEVDLLKIEREAFINGDEKRGIDGCLKKCSSMTPEIGNKLFDQMMKFAEYAFNKSHATAYAKVAYITAWLNYYHPAEYLATCIQYAKNEEKPALVVNCKKAGVDIRVPDVNESDVDVKVSDSEILLGLSQVSGLNQGSYKIVAERDENGPFTSISDFIKRVKLNKRTLVSLLNAGAFDMMIGGISKRNGLRSKIGIWADDIKELNEEIANKQSLEQVLEALAAGDIEKAKSLNKGKKPARKSVETKLANAEQIISDLNVSIWNIRIPDTAYDLGEELSLEKEALGFFVSGHPLDVYEDVTSITSLEPTVKGDLATLVATVSELKKYKSKKTGDDFAFLSLDTRLGTIKGCCFEKDVVGLLSEKTFVFKGYIKEDDEENTFYIKKAEDPSKRAVRVLYPVSTIADIVLSEQAKVMEHEVESSDYVLRWFIRKTGEFIDTEIHLPKAFVEENNLTIA